ncbi:MAG: D-2-hydroxyacid dehydrogenase [Sandaracinaceae bacterium]|nr:D-2-hydroxyacid dehydrogenase [Sandaracinaceae bacterium]
MRRVIHVFSPQAARFADLVAAQDPTREVVCWTERGAFDAGLGSARVLLAPYPPREGWEGARRLELIQLCGVGADHFLPSPDLPAHVEIAGMRGAMAPDAAEHAMTMLLALRRGLPGFLDDQRARVWRQRSVPRLAGARLAIVGLGAIGRAVASRAAAFGLEVRGVRRGGAPVAGVAQVLTPDRLEELLRWCDAVVICAPRTPETLGLIDAAALAALRDDALLVNVSRGGLVDEAALLERLRAGTLRAALDVFEDEPLSADSSFWDAPYTIVTPHVAGYGEGYLDRAVELLLANVARLERGEPREGLVDRARGY